MQRAAAALLLPLSALAASSSFYDAPFERRPAVAELTALGRALFSDPSLSASGKLSCAGCHDPAHAYGPPDGASVRPGGALGGSLGTRAVPSLRYLQKVPAFSEHYTEDEGPRVGQDQGPAGGYTWDGRAATTHDQARLPLFSPLEMANAGEDDVVRHLQRSAHAQQFRSAFGAHVFEQPALAFKGLLLALEVFQQDPAEFYPYSSKYDAYLRGQAQLSPAEARGLQLFNDPRKGNCANCHISSMEQGAFPAFSDFGFIALGVPRNPAIPANRDAAYHDLGLCGPARTDLAAHSEFCGLFRTPSLRNVSMRRVYFHNGAMHDLRKVLEFYVQRDTQPQRWYPRDAHGRVNRYDDLPVQFHGNVNQEPPFGRHAGDQPALTAKEIDDVLAFLGTLSDGYAARPLTDHQDRNARCADASCCSANPPSTATACSPRAASSAANASRNTAAR
ncbi:MAG TPA: cytochrome c peroxidase [Nevskiaceae bacterium]|nr:cytochrome c peroxidase [Nevskiaceae bacterium]